MFSEALKIVSQFTNPITVSSKTFDNKVQCGIGTYIVINNEGWVITVSHVFNVAQKFLNDKPLLETYYKEIEEIEINQSLSKSAKIRKISKIKKDPNWITNLSYWWGRDHLKIEKVRIYPEIDLAIGQLEPFSPANIKIYPKFKKPDELDTGTSLCKLGFPFHQINSTFNDETKSFKFPEGAVPLPFFPIEGILTRFKLSGATSDGKFNKKFIETSSPGLKGQSGGPIFDINGNIWGIQSHTDSLLLGFNPIIDKDGKKIEEHQFMNVGLGVHPENIIKVLTENNIKFEIAQ